MIRRIAGFIKSLGRPSVAVVVHSSGVTWSTQGMLSHGRFVSIAGDLSSSNGLRLCAEGMADSLRTHSIFSPVIDLYFSSSLCVFALSSWEPSAILDDDWLAICRRSIKDVWDDDSHEPFVMHSAVRYGQPVLSAAIRKEFCDIFAAELARASRGRVRNLQPCLHSLLKNFSNETELKLVVCVDEDGAIGIGLSGGRPAWVYQWPFNDKVKLLEASRRVCLSQGCLDFSPESVSFVGFPAGDESFPEFAWLLRKVLDDQPNH